MNVTDYLGHSVLHVKVAPQAVKAYPVTLVRDALIKEFIDNIFERL